MTIFLPPTNVFFIIADLLQVLVLLVIAEVIVSWMVMFGTISSYQPWVRTLRKVTGPVLEPFRRIIPPHKLRGLDISPILAILIIQIVQGILTRLGSH